MRLEQSSRREPELPLLGDRVQTGGQNLELGWLVVPAARVRLRRPRFLKIDDGAPRPTREKLVTRLSKMVDAKLRKGTRLIDVKVEHTSPEMAALIANSLLTEFLGQNFEQNASTADTAYNFLRNEEKRLKVKLEQSERAMQEYKEQTKSVSLEDRQNVVVEKLKELNQKVTEAKSLRILHESSYNQALQFNGADQYVTNTNFPWTSGGPVTVAFWVNTPGGSRASIPGVVSLGRLCPSSKRT